MGFEEAQREDWEGKEGGEEDGNILNHGENLVIINSRRFQPTV